MLFFFADAAPSGGSVAISPESASHAQTASQVTLSAKSAVNPASSAHSHAATAFTIAAKASVSPASARSTHLASVAVVSFKTVLAPASVAMALSSTSTTTTARASFTVSSATHSLSSGSPSVSVTTISIIPAVGLHGHSSTIPTISVPVVIPANDNLVIVSNTESSLRIPAVIHQRITFSRHRSGHIAGRSTARSTPTRMFRRGR